MNINDLSQAMQRLADSRHGGKTKEYIAIKNGRFEVIQGKASGESKLSFTDLLEKIASTVDTTRKNSENLGGEEKKELVARLRTMETNLDTIAENYNPSGLINRIWYIFIGARTINASKMETYKKIDECINDLSGITALNNFKASLRAYNENPEETPLPFKELKTILTTDLPQKLLQVTNFFYHYNNHYNDNAVPIIPEQQNVIVNALQLFKDKDIQLYIFKPTSPDNGVFQALEQSVYQFCNEKFPKSFNENSKEYRNEINQALQQLINGEIGTKTLSTIENRIANALQKKYPELN